MYEAGCAGHIHPAASFYRRYAEIISINADHGTQASQYTSSIEPGEAGPRQCVYEDYAEDDQQTGDVDESLHEFRNLLLRARQGHHTRYYAAARRVWQTALSRRVLTAYESGSTLPGVRSLGRSQTRVIQVVFTRNGIKQF